MLRLLTLRRYLAIGGILIILGTVGAVFALHAYSSKSNAQSNTQSSNLDSKGFVTRSGAQLILNGKPFRFAGANIYWLGLDENVGGVNYPTHFRVDDAFSAVAEMGATVVRSHTLGISVGCSLCLEPSLGNFNQTAFDSIDYAIQSAAEHHIHLVIPLVDNWHYYHGGKHTFTDWRSINNENKFFTDKTVIHDFEEYINTLLNHVNQYTGVAYKNDPTIMAWETGNELVPPVSWTKTIADYIKSIDNSHLVMDGTALVNTDALSLTNVDIYTQHYYPANISQMQSDAATTTAAKKVFLVGEYDWVNGDPLSSFLAAIEKSSAAGDLYWDFFPHNDTYGYVQHGDNFTLHYPGDTSSMREAVQLLRAHAYRMQGRPAPPVGTPGAPVITGIQGKTIAWRGTALGDTYSVERSTAGPDGPWTVICDRCATDNTTPWTDAKQPSGHPWYRVQAYNIAGVVGPYSNVYEQT
jgi:mannan endo-1,4-beta-mannosidase